MEPKTLGQRIATRRKELGLTREELAVACGVSVTAVQLWESGKTKNLKLNHLFAIADALNLSPRWLSDGRGHKEAAPNYEAYSTALSRRDEAESDEKKRGWERIAAVFAKAALVLLLIVPPFVEQRAEAAICHKPNCSSLSFANHMSRLHIVARWIIRQIMFLRCSLTFRRLSDIAIA